MTTIIERLHDREMCAACRIVAATCQLPAEAIGLEGVAPIPTCWTCAHLITEHGATLETATAGEDCNCPDEMVYPAPRPDDERN